MSNEAQEEDLDDEGRRMPPMSADEVDTLQGFLDYQRATFAWRTSNVTTEQLRRRLGHPSTMTLAGMMKHLALVEDQWITITAGEEELPPVWRELGITRDDDWDWKSALEDSGDGLRALWSGATQRSRDVLARLLAGDRAEALAATHPAWGGQANVSLRWILTHMIEEYARHNGHADLLREAIDGQTGE